MAHFPETLMFQRMYDRLAMGEPTHLAMEKMVSQNALLVKGACKSIPTTGKTHVVIVLACCSHGYQSLPRPHSVSQPYVLICVVSFFGIWKTGPCQPYS